MGDGTVYTIGTNSITMFTISFVNTVPCGCATCSESRQLVQQEAERVALRREQRAMQVLCDEREFFQIVMFCFVTACVFVVGLARRAACNAGPC
jgi:hypothetical protein